MEESKKSFLEGKNLIIGVLLVICLALIGYGVWVTDMVNYVSGQEASQKAVDYINKEILGGNYKAELSGKVEEEKGVFQLYKFKVKIDGNEMPSYVYVSKNGKVLFPESISLAPSTSTATGDNSQPEGATCETVAKTDKPVLEAFVVSGCPYGLQMQRVLEAAVKAESSMGDYIKIKYMGSVSGGKVVSMHGEEEAKENLKQICIREEQKDKFYAYLACYMKAGDSVGCSTSANINAAQLNACISDANKGIKYAKADFAAQDSYNNTDECRANPELCVVAGSPSLILNGQKVSEFNFGGRNVEAIKSLLCCGSSQQPGFCSKTFSTEQAADSFSETYTDSGTSGGSSTCN